MTDVPIRCRCGRVRGVARDVAPSNVNHALCYCHDCRAFAHWLERDDVLEAHGASEIVQIARARVELTEGQSELRCMRLGPKGLHRWYAACCKTPLGNTIPRMPFVGLARAAIDRPRDDDEVLFGRPAKIWVGSAVGGEPPGPTFVLGAAAHGARLLAAWWLRGLGHPTPFFDRDNRPTVTPTVLSSAERQKLREHPRA